MKSYCHKALIWRLILGLVNANFLYTRPLTNSVSLEGAVRFSQNSVSLLHFFFFWVAFKSCLKPTYRSLIFLPVNNDLANLLKIEFKLLAFVCVSPIAALMWCYNFAQARGSGTVTCGVKGWVSRLGACANYYVNDLIPLFIKQSEACW